ncbi:MAG: pyridoxamine 5'-phosphate oxidase, partial [Candidatus Competibacterales bacterium]|nr:pyridoxamine 5'-phosphate oxidase [Candidatus Competibacterales bacterium]
YALARLDEDAVASDPISQFERWFTEAQHAELPEPNAMTLATVDPEGRPQARVVLLKDFGPEGFVFYTNYQSAKGRELAARPHAALLFLWIELERQVRIDGPVTRVAEAESEAYFRIRPRASQLGALASQQSRVVADRATLDRRFAELEDEYANREIPRPAHWGGYSVRADTVEFWQGRRSRLHDRLRYRRAEDGGWRLERLEP